MSARLVEEQRERQGLTGMYRTSKEAGIVVLCRGQSGRGGEELGGGAPERRVECFFMRGG